MSNEERRTEADIHVNEDLYTTKQAMKVLRRSERRVQQMCERSELDCWHVDGRWAISKASVHTYLDQHGTGKPRGRRQREEDTDQQVRELISEIRRLEREVGRLEGRMERADETQDTLQTQLRREQERASNLERELAKERRAVLELRAALVASVEQPTDENQGGECG